MTSTPTLDEIVVDWRTSLEAAEDAVRATRRLPLERSLRSNRARCVRAPSRPPAAPGREADRSDRTRRAHRSSPLARGTARHESAAGSAADRQGLPVRPRRRVDRERGDPCRCLERRTRRVRVPPLRPGWASVRHSAVRHAGLLGAHPRPTRDSRACAPTSAVAASWCPRAFRTTALLMTQCMLLRTGRSVRSRDRLARDPVNVLRGSRRYLECAREAGLRRIVVSPSTSTGAILERADLVPLVEACIDGRVMERQGLESKPAPDTTLAACALLDLSPNRVAAFETTLAGVEAAKFAGIGFVIAVERHGGEALLNKAPIGVVTSLGDLIDPAI